MKRLLAIVVAVFAIGTLSALAATADASTGTHWCRQGDPPIQASTITSCSFAGRFVNGYVYAGELRNWGGRVYSPVTHKRYWITCRRTGPANFAYEKVTCTGINGIWTRFAPLYN